MLENQPDHMTVIVTGILSAAAGAILATIIIATYKKWIPVLGRVKRSLIGKFKCRVLGKHTYCLAIKRGNPAPGEFRSQSFCSFCNSIETTYD